MQNDRVISEKWFIRNSLNLEAEALVQLTALDSMENMTRTTRERLRLFYVGITRAKRELIVTRDSGQ